MKLTFFVVLMSAVLAGCAVRRTAVGNHGPNAAPPPPLPGEAPDLSAPESNPIYRFVTDRVWQGDGVWSNGVFSFLNWNTNRCVMFRENVITWRILEFGADGNLLASGSAISE